MNARPTTTNQILDEYERHLAAVDREFHRVSGKFTERMHCGRGCSMCCSQMFSISAIEAAYISRTVKEMSEEEQNRLRERAAEYTDSARQLTGAVDNDEGFVPRPGLRLPCPALKDDACSIYGARPIICHKWGIPIFNPRKPLELQACELNFQPGEEIETEGLLEPQVELLEDWVELKQRVVDGFPDAGARTTIAEAILKDCEERFFSSSSYRLKRNSTLIREETRMK
jgi:Fe-S-cluster containining protein